jgi:hypothetical protein
VNINIEEKEDDVCMESDDENDSSDDDAEWTIPCDDVQEEPELETVDNLSDDTKFIIYKGNLEQLLPSQCFLCGTVMQKADFMWRMLGTVVHIQHTCKKCLNLWEWASQPFSGMMPWGNLIIAAAIFFSGESPVKALNMLSFAGIRCFSYRTYSSTLFPLFNRCPNNSNIT